MLPQCSANEEQHSEPYRTWQILTAYFDLAGVFYLYLHTSWSQTLRPLWKIWRCYAYSDLLISLVLGNRSSTFFCIFFLFSQRWPDNHITGHITGYEGYDISPRASWAEMELATNVYSCFEKGFLTNGKKLTRKCWTVILGNGSFYGCLIEPQGVSAWLKETAQTPIFLLSLSLMLNLEPQSSKNRTLTTHNANRHFRVRFYTFVGQFL